MPARLPHPPRAPANGRPPRPSRTPPSPAAEVAATPPERAPVALRLLGGFELLRGDRPVHELSSRKAQALLALLVLAGGRPLGRERLAGLLWPDRSEAAAHQSLRQALYVLHRALDDPAAERVRGNALFLWADPRLAAATDVAALELAAARARSPQGEAEATLAEIGRLYRGELLAGLFLDGAEPFADWLASERGRLRDLAVGALLALLDRLADRGDPRLALESAERVLAIDPLCEEAVRHRMRLLARAGRRAGALAGYESLRERLEEELGAEPETPTRALRQAILAGGSRLAGAGGIARMAWGGTEPAIPFVGREAELAALADAARAAAHGEPHLTLLTGGPGSGRSRLARTALQAIAHREGPAIVLLGDALARTAPARLGPLGEALASVPHPAHAGPASETALASLAARVPGLCALLPGCPCPRAIPAPDGEELAETVAAFLVRLAEETRPRPALVALLLEELDAAAPACLSLLARLFALLPPDAPVWILASGRSPGLRRALVPEGIPATRISELEIGPLGERAIGEMAAALVEGEDVEPIAGALARASAGLPWAMAEGVNLLVDTGALEAAPSGRWRLASPRTAPELPAGIAGLVERRIALLSPESRRLLALAAAAGHRFDAALLATAEGEAPAVVEATLAVLVERRMVRPWIASWLPNERERDRALFRGAVAFGRFELAQPALREYVLRRIPIQRRRAIHGRLAAAIERLHPEGGWGIDEAAARHWWRAGERARAVPHLEAAAARAEACGDEAAAGALRLRGRRARERVTRPARP